MTKYTIKQAMELTQTTTPKAALDKLKSQDRRFSYTPHIGNKQKLKHRIRLAKRDI